MNFLEAVKAMKEGKKVKLAGWNPIILDGQVFKFIDRKGNKHKVDLRYSEVEATDWEIVDDKDWNLAENMSYGYDWVSDAKLFSRSSVKKCRDLILEDIDGFCKENFYDNPEAVSVLEWLSIVVKKRFGDLE